MDLWNAKLQRIDRPATPSATGRRVYVEGDSISVHCVLDGVSRAIALSLGAELAETDAVLYVTSAQLPAGVSLASGDRVLVQPWVRTSNEAFGPATLYEIRRLSPLAGDELTHYQCALKALT